MYLYIHGETSTTCATANEAKIGFKFLFKSISILNITENKT